MNKSAYPKIYLIHPPTRAYRGLGASLAGNEHIGLEYVASYLRNSRYDVSILNIEGNYRLPRVVAEQVFLAQPLWVGISPTSLSIEWSIEFGKFLKNLTTIPFVFGGHLSTHMGADLLKHIECADIVVAGDGELTALALSKALESKGSHLEKVPSIFFRKHRQIMHSGTPLLPSSLDELHWPVRPTLESIGKSNSARILTSRGCPYRCSFCTTPAFYQRQIRYRSIEDVVREMIFLNQKYGVTNFPINDDIFIDGSLNSILRTISLSRLLKEKLPSISFRPLCRTDVFLRHEELLSELHAAGMKCIFIGLESANDNDLKHLRKDIKVSQNEVIIKLLNKYNISLMIGFIMYTEVSTFESLRQNLEYLYSIDQLFRTTAICRSSLGFPGTDIYSEMLRTGRFDRQRSTPFILYPKFRDERIRELSLAMEEVEELFASVDSKMLSARVNLYDETLRLTNGKNPVLQRARSILDEISKIYLTSFILAISFAKAGNSSDKIVSVFREILPRIESLCCDFELTLNKGQLLEQWQNCAY
ncbi:MAG: B12-binding domain-containing radical SAM protein [Nitrospirae bacterium]|nr:B12-binding domain-containing radical SAM protein [Nitrospirota bacterium]